MKHIQDIRLAVLKRGADESVYLDTIKDPGWKKIFKSAPDFGATFIILETAYGPLMANIHFGYLPELIAQLDVALWRLERERPALVRSTEFAPYVPTLFFEPEGDYTYVSSIYMDGSGLGVVFPIIELAEDLPDVQSFYEYVDSHKKELFQKTKKEIGRDGVVRARMETATCIASLKREVQRGYQVSGFFNETVPDVSRDKKHD